MGQEFYLLFLKKKSELITLIVPVSLYSLNYNFPKHPNGIGQYRGDPILVTIYKPSAFDRQIIRQGAMCPLVLRVKIVDLYYKMQPSRLWYINDRKLLTVLKIQGYL